MAKSLKSLRRSCGGSRLYTTYIPGGAPKAARPDEDEAGMSATRGGELSGMTKPANKRRSRLDMRLADEDRDILEEMSSRLNLPMSGLVKHALSLLYLKFLDQVEETRK